MLWVLARVEKERDVDQNAHDRCKICAEGCAGVLVFLLAGARTRHAVRGGNGADKSSRNPIFLELHRPADVIYICVYVRMTIHTMHIRSARNWPKT